MSQNLNDYTWWKAALRGEKQPVHDGHPQAGFYRKRSFKNGPWIPVAIWMENGAWVALQEDKPVDASEIWTWVCKNPVTHEAYQAARAGKGWPDDAPKAETSPGAGHNLPSDPFEALKLEFDGEAELAREFLKTPITTHEQANQAGVWSKKLSNIAKKATDLHKVEKQPSLDESRRIDDKWRDLKEGPADLSKALKRHADAFLQEQLRLEQERQRLAREEADRKQREAAEALAKAATSDDVARAEAERLAKEAEAAEREAQARNIQAGRTGAKIALRTFVSAEITDYDALLIALKDRAEIREVVITLANRAARSGVDLPGMKIKEEKRAA